jgi:hypothetical protein
VTRRTFVLGCGVVALIAVVVVGCGIAVAISELPSGEHPTVDFEAPEISAAREAKIAELEADLDAVERRFQASHVGQRGRVDRCEAGQDNFTRQDAYAYSCRMNVVQLMPLREPLRDDVSRLGEALLPGECPDGTDTDRALARHSGDPERILWATGDCTPGQSMGGAQIVTLLSADPTADDVQLMETLLGSRCPLASIRREHCDVRLFEVRSTARSASSTTVRLAVVVAADFYYSIPWKCPWPASWFREGCRGPARVR